MLQLAAVDGITQVMSGTVGHIGNQVHILTFLAAKQTIHGIDHHLDDVDVLPFIETADIVGFRNLSLMENQVDGTGMVFHIEPVAYVLALAINGQPLAVADIVDEQRNQFLGELVRTVVVGAVGYDNRHAVSVVEGTYEMVRTCLAGAVRTVGIIFCGFLEELLTVGQMVFAG